MDDEAAVAIHQRRLAVNAISTARIMLHRTYQFTHFPYPAPVINIAIRAQNASQNAVLN